MASADILIPASPNADGTKLHLPKCRYFKVDLQEKYSPAAILKKKCGLCKHHINAYIEKCAVPSSPRGVTEPKADGLQYYATETGTRKHLSPTCGSAKKMTFATAGQIDKLETCLRCSNKSPTVAVPVAAPTARARRALTSADAEAFASFVYYKTAKGGNGKYHIRGGCSHARKEATANFMATPSNPKPPANEICVNCINAVAPAKSAADSSDSESDE